MLQSYYSIGTTYTVISTPCSKFKMVIYINPFATGNTLLCVTCFKKVNVNVHVFNHVFIVILLRWANVYGPRRLPLVASRKTIPTYK